MSLPLLSPRITRELGMNVLVTSRAIVSSPFPSHPALDPILLSLPLSVDALSFPSLADIRFTWDTTPSFQLYQDLGGYWNLPLRPPVGATNDSYLRWAHK